MEKFESLADFLGVQDPQQPDRPVTDGASAKVSIKAFCADILDSRQYRESILRRIIMDSLPPAVECLLHHYANGKPVEHVEHTGKDGAPIETVTEVRRVIIRASEREIEETHSYTTH